MLKHKYTLFRAPSSWEHKTGDKNHKNVCFIRKGSLRWHFSKDFSFNLTMLGPKVSGISLCQEKDGGKRTTKVSNKRIF